MRARKILVMVVGTAQTVVGVLAVIFVYVLYLDFLGVRTRLNVSGELAPLYLLVLIVFGFFSIMGGFFLIHEGLESR